MLFHVKRSSDEAMLSELYKNSTQCRPSRKVCILLYKHVGLHNFLATHLLNCLFWLQASKNIGENINKRPSYMSFLSLYDGLLYFTLHVRIGTYNFSLTLIVLDIFYWKKQEVHLFYVTIIAFILFLLNISSRKQTVDM